MRFPLTCAVLLTSALSACTKDVPVTEVSGGCTDVYKSQVCTWASMKGPAVVEVGATVPLSSIENAPADDPMVWPPVTAAALDIPEAARKESGFTHFTMYWEAGGHPPGPYMTPHFDFHFYSISTADRTSIDCVDTSKPTSLPTGYGLPDVPLPPDMAKMMGVASLIGLCVPQMGMHSMPQTELDSKEPFRGDMVVGYIKGKHIFTEPMLSKAMLMEKKTFDLDVPAIPGVGAHPTKFHAEYDAAKNSYRFAFSGFVPAA